MKRRYQPIFHWTQLDKTTTNQSNETCTVALGDKCNFRLFLGLFLLIWVSYRWCNNRIISNIWLAVFDNLTWVSWDWTVLQTGCYWIDLQPTKAAISDQWDKKQKQTIKGVHTIKRSFTARSRCCKSLFHLFKRRDLGIDRRNAAEDLRLCSGSQGTSKSETYRVPKPCTALKMNNYILKSYLEQRCSSVSHQLKPVQYQRKCPGWEKFAWISSGSQANTLS